MFDRRQIASPLRAPAPGGSAAKYREARLLAIVNLLLVAAVVISPLWVSALFFAGTGMGGASDFILVPVIFLVNMAAIIAVSGHDGFQRQVMLMGLLLKFAAVGAYMTVAFEYYGGAADVSKYHTGAYLLALQFAQGNLQLPAPITGSNFVIVLGSAFYSAFGTSFPSLSVAFASCAYWGVYLLYRSFRISFPHGDHRLAGLVLFATPSLVFWNAALGKDALAALFVSMIVYGFALTADRTSFRAYALMFGGAAGMLMIRPHIAAMLAMAALVPFAFGRVRGGFSGMALKMAMIPVLIAGGMYVYNGAKDFVELKDVSQVTTVMQRVARGNVAANQGSTFAANQSVARRALYAPFLPFRPFPWEAHSLLSFLAATEAVVLLGFTVRHLRQLLSLLRHWRHEPFVGFLAGYCAIFMVVFAGAMTNFGLLVRERVMMLPMFLLLLIADARVLRQTVGLGRTRAAARVTAAS